MVVEAAVATVDHSDIRGSVVAEIAEQEPEEFSACSACSAVYFLSRPPRRAAGFWLGALGVLGGEFRLTSANSSIILARVVR